MSAEFRDLFGEDVPTGNDDDRVGPSLHVTQDEIDELLFSEQWPVEERLRRLEELRGELAELSTPEAGENDPTTLIASINEAIRRLGSGEEIGPDPLMVDHDPMFHRETLAPDSDELADLKALDDADDDDDLSDPLDEKEWIDGDGFEPDKGVR